MSGDTRREAPQWPGLDGLQEAWAAHVARVASQRQAETNWSAERTARIVGDAAAAQADVIAEALVAAGEMALDLWLLSR